MEDERIQYLEGQGYTILHSGVDFLNKYKEYVTNITPDYYPCAVKCVCEVSSSWKDKLILSILY